MRLDDETLVLSERNLLALLVKLHTPGSACKIQGGSDCPMSVSAEPDLAHYGKRGYGAGPMHPLTQRVMSAVREAMDWDDNDVVFGAEQDPMDDVGFAQDQLDHERRQ